MAEIRKPGCAELAMYEGNEILIYYSWEYKMVLCKLLWKIIWQFYKMLNRSLLDDLAIPLLWYIYPRNESTF